MAIKITEEEFIKKFGTYGLEQTQPEKKPGFVDRTKQAFSGGISKVKEVYKQPAKNPAQFVENVGKLGAGVAEAAFSPITAAAEPVIRPTIGKVINYAADKISDNPSVQKFADSKAGNATSRVAQTVSDYATIAGSVTGPKAVKPAVGAAGSGITKAGQTVSKGMQPIKNVARDVVPTKGRLVNSNVTKSLDLTAGDASNFFQSQGKDVGRFVADHNLIRANKDMTVKAIDDFFKQSHATVRSEIAKVKTVYQPNQIPRYVESLKAIKSVTDDVPGLQKASVEIDNLLNKKNNIRLEDVQKVKELVDKYHGIYKRTGDVKDGVKAQGLDNIRRELKEYIEVEVKKNTGADIRALNKSVSGSKEILEMAEVRSPRGLTSSNLGIGDWATFGAVTGLSFPAVGLLAPAVGIAAVFIKKAVQSPAVMLRIAKMLDKMDDAQKAKIKASLEAGQIPKEFDQFIKKKK